MAKDAVRLEITSNIGEKMTVLQKKMPVIHERAMVAVGLQLINNIANGSSHETVVPPVLTGLLRGSGSVFYGSKHVFSLPPYNGQGKPNTSHSGREGEITVGFDTAYAARWHETNFIPGPVSKDSGDVGYKYVEKHLQHDGKALFQLYADIMKKDLL